MSTEEATEDVPTTTAAPPKPTPEEKALAKQLKHRAKWKLFWIVSIISLVADQATKIWARATLPTYPRKPGLGANYVCDIPMDLVPATDPKCSAEAISVIDSFWHWRLSMNEGSAFGLFSGQGQVGRVLLSLVGIGAVIGMMWMLKKARADQKVLHWALAFVAGGAVGNLIDRVYYGVVTDFILWHWGSEPAKGNVHRFATEWPVFNIADVVLVIGVGLMFIDIQKEGKREKEKKKRRQEKARAAGLVKDL
jgi:signal peptidase II